MVVSDPMNTINIMSGIHVSEIDSSLLKGAGRSLLFDRQVKGRPFISLTEDAQPC